MNENILDEEIIVCHEIQWGRLVYTEKGILFITFFGLYKKLIEWSNIMYIMFIPSVMKNNEEWIIYDGSSINDLYEINCSIGLKNRNLLKINKFSILFLWFRSFLHFVPYLNLDNENDKIKGKIKSVNIKLNTLSVSKNEYFNLIEKYTFIEGSGKNYDRDLLLK